MSGPYLGDFAEDSTHYFYWDSNDADGASVTRDADGAIWIYKADATATEVQTGLTDTENHDGNTGVHCLKMILTDGFYTTGADYAVILKAATIDGQTVNAVLATFSIENRFAEVDAVKIGGTGQTGRDLGASVLLSAGTGTGQVTISSGVVAASGNWNTVTPDASGVVATALGNLETHGDSTWSTVTGYATPTNITSASGVVLHGDYDAAKSAAQAGDAMTLAGDAVSAAALKTDAVEEIRDAIVGSGAAHQVKVDASGQTTAENMVGTDNASTHDAAGVKTALEADGSKLDHLWEMTEDDSGTRRLTTNALEQGPDTIAGITLHGDYDPAKTAAQSGDPMTLANDAITSAKYDESSAYPVKSADTGASQIARVGADGDTLETVSGQIDGTSTHAASDVATAILVDASKKIYADANGDVRATLASSEDGKRLTQILKALHRVRGTLYFCRSDGDDANAGTYNSPKVRPDLIFTAAANGDGTGVCILDYIDVGANWTRLKNGHRCFGFGPINSGLTSSLCKMGTAEDIHDVTYQALPGEVGQHGIIEITNDCVLSDLTLRADADLVCCLSSLGIGSPRKPIVERLEILGNEYAVRIEENITYAGEMIFRDCYIRAWTPVRLSSSNWILRFEHGCQLVHNPDKTSTGLTPSGISASFGGRVYIDDAEFDIRPTAADTSAHGISTVTNGQYGGNATVVARNVKMTVKKTGSGTAYDYITDSGTNDVIMVRGGNADADKFSGNVSFGDPAGELQADWADGGRLDVILDSATTIKNLTTENIIITTSTEET